MTKNSSVVIWTLRDKSPPVSYDNYIILHKAFSLELYRLIYPDNAKIDYLLFYDDEIGVFSN